MSGFFFVYSLVGGFLYTFLIVENGKKKNYLHFKKKILIWINKKLFLQESTGLWVKSYLFYRRIYKLDESVIIFWSGFAKS